jgi:hypothetical protein
VYGRDSAEDWKRRWEERTNEARDAGRRPRCQDAGSGSGPKFGGSVILVAGREPGDAILIEKATDILQSLPTFD